MSDAAMIDGWLAWYAAGDAADSTIRLRRHHLHRFTRTHRLDAVTEADLITWLTMSSGTAANSRRSMRASLRSFYTWAVTRDLLESDPTARLRGISEPEGIPNPISELALARALAAGTGEAVAMLLLGAYAGLRRHEIAKVHSDDVTDLGLMVTGKGGKTRRVPIHPILAPYLPVAGWLFPSWRRPGQPVTGDYVADRLEVVLPDPWTPHSLRHRFATQCYRACHDIRTVQQLLGHSSITTTVRYIQLDHDALAAAVLAVA